MKREIRYCRYCNLYTMKEVCRICGRETIIKKPPRFSPQDRYGRYRRRLKKLERGLIHGGDSD